VYNLSAFRSFSGHWTNTTRNISEHDISAGWSSGAIGVVGTLLLGWFVFIVLERTCVRPARTVFDVGVFWKKIYATSQLFFWNYSLEDIYSHKHASSRYKLPVNVTTSEWATYDLGLNT
jgi:hypothetical protein